MTHVQCFCENVTKSYEFNLAQRSRDSSVFTKKDQSIIKRKISSSVLLEIVKVVFKFDRRITRNMLVLSLLHRDENCIYTVF